MRIEELWAQFARREATGGGAQRAWNRPAVGRQRSEP
jgi:hypothetical protein